MLRRLFFLLALTIATPAVGQVLGVEGGGASGCAGLAPGQCQVLADLDADGDYADDFERAVYELLYPGAGELTAESAAAVNCTGSVCSLATPVRFIDPGSFTATNGTLTVTDDGAGNLVGDVDPPTLVEDFATGCSTGTSCLGGVNANPLTPLPVIFETVVFTGPTGGGPLTCALNAAGSKASGDCSSASLSGDGTYIVTWPATLTGEMLADFESGAPNEIDYSTGVALWEFSGSPGTPTASFDYQADPRSPHSRVYLLPPKGETALAWERPVRACWHTWATVPASGETPTCDLPVASYAADAPRAELVLPSTWSHVALECDIDPAALSLPTGHVACLAVGNASTAGLAPAQDGLRPRWAMLGEPTLRILRTPATGAHALVGFWRDGGEGTFRLVVDFPTSGLPGTGQGGPAILAGPRAATEVSVPSTAHRRTVRVDGRQDQSVVGGRNVVVNVGVPLTTAEAGTGVPGWPDFCTYGGVDYDCEGLTIAGLRQGNVVVSEFRDLLIRDSDLSSTLACVEQFFPGTGTTSSESARLRGTLQIDETVRCTSSSTTAGTAAFARVHANPSTWTCNGGASLSPGIFSYTIRAAGLLASSAGSGTTAALGIDNVLASRLPAGCTGTGATVVDAGIALGFAANTLALFTTQGPNSSNAYQGRVGSDRSVRLQLRVDGAAAITPPQCVQGLPADGSFAACGGQASGLIVPRAGTVGAVTVRNLSAASANTKACTVRMYRNGSLMDVTGPGKSADGVDFQWGSAALDAAGESVTHWLLDQVAAGDRIEARFDEPLSQFCPAGSGCVCDDVADVAIDVDLLP